jgi:predicted RNase H-like nuclease (RuvC/YqgF family)
MPAHVTPISSAALSGVELDIHNLLMAQAKAEVAIGEIKERLAGAIWQEAVRTFASQSAARPQADVEAAFNLYKTTVGKETEAAERLQALGKLLEKVQEEIGRLKMDHPAEFIRVLEKDIAGVQKEIRDLEEKAKQLTKQTKEEEKRSKQTLVPLKKRLEDLEKDLQGLKAPGGGAPQQP